MMIALIRRLAFGSLLSGVAGGVPVTGWVATNGDAGFVGSTATTSSPVTTSADADTVAGGFAPVTLAVGESLTLTGSVVITGNSGGIPGNQFRWGLFNAPGTPVNGAGSNYVGVWAAAPSTGNADLVTANGSTTNPFSGSASTVVSSAGDVGGQVPQFGEELSFSLTVTRLSTTQISTEASLSNGSDFLIEWPATFAPASPANFTYNAAAFLLGGTTDATQAAFANVEATPSQPTADSDGDGMPDDYESANGLNPAVNDADDDLDGDTLSNLAEYLGPDGTPNTGDETLPNQSDTDGDSLSDGFERANGTNPLLADSDSDGLTDAVESGTGQFVDASNTGTDPLDADSDGDGVSDGVEVSDGTNPNDAASRLDEHFLAIDFNRNDALGAPSQSGFRVLAGAITSSVNEDRYTKRFGPVEVTLSQPDEAKLEFQGANTDGSRAIPGGDTSLAFLVCDFVGTRQGTLDLTFANLPAGTYVLRSYHLDPFTSDNLGFAQGSSPTTPNTIQTSIGGAVVGSGQPTSLGSAGWNTTFIDDGMIPVISTGFTHDGSEDLTVRFTATESNGDDAFLLLNGFQLFRTN